jgi:hypothetical protein
MIAYKLFRIKGNEIFPLYVLANQPTPMGEWLQAQEGEPTKDGKKVKSRLGALAYRPGWHCSERPIATHIGEKKDPSDSKAKPFYRPANQVWCEVEVEDTIDYQPMADKAGKTATKKQLKYVPVHGFYKYKTNPNMFGDWIIAGHIKVNKILTDLEVVAINDSFGDGLQDLPRR